MLTLEIKNKIVDEANERFGNMFGTCKAMYTADEVVQHCIDSRIAGATAYAEKLELAEAEIERLKGLIEKEFRLFRDVDDVDRRWQTFKTENNL